METLDVENNNNINNSDGGLSTPSNVLNNIENVSNHDGEEENLMVENDDEYAGIENLSQEELIDIIKEIREEYFNLKDKHRELNAINNNSQASSSNQSTPLNQSPSNAIPPVTKKISEYPLNYKQQDVVELYTPDYQLPAGKAPTRSPSFWQSPTGFLSYWVGWDTPMEEIADNSNDDTASSSSSAPKPKPPQSYPITKTFEEKAPIKTFSPSSSQPNPVLILPASKK
ncbi:hypothetical protein PPL_07537 [Heterostelium album PN500]|uniref:Uncharacterized protein n=1 Tax=Heterostelium pallidum (strain ATCC 26659 / Pp 5 / PN500) TaxID=670386 RepID=D3BG86_HETP5|nr:hypothetical protein PPL_07537 [Heterostelium album PN500]EFA79486.1 hypothetical protein PPL_07537 [Heterostelium album PN500]|eukprot:XP_020431607.1 hypothetical protein PPL_07537 [Heterostelium album PN500]